MPQRRAGEEEKAAGGRERGVGVLVVEGERVSSAFLDFPGDAVKLRTRLRILGTMDSNQISPIQNQSRLGRSECLFLNNLSLGLREALTLKFSDLINLSIPRW